MKRDRQESCHGEKKQWKKENGYRLAEKMEKWWRLLVTLFNYQRFLFLSQLYSHSKLNETIRELKCNSTLYVLRRIIILFRRRSSLTRNLSLFLVTLTEIAFTFGLICKRISNEFIPKCQGYIFWENWMISWRKGSFMNEGSLTPIHLQRSSEKWFHYLNYSHAFLRIQWHMGFNRFHLLKILSPLLLKHNISF